MMTRDEAIRVLRERDGSDVERFEAGFQWGLYAANACMRDLRDGTVDHPAQPKAKVKEFLLVPSNDPDELVARVVTRLAGGALVHGGLPADQLDEAFTPDPGGCGMSGVPSPTAWAPRADDPPFEVPSVEDLRERVAEAGRIITACRELLAPEGQAGGDGDLFE